MKAGVTFGNAGLYRALIWLLGWIDVRVIYALMAVFVIPFTLIFSSAAHLTYKYYRRRLGNNVLKAHWLTYRNHCMFGQTVIDKFSMYAGRKFRMNYHGKEIYEAMGERDEAFIQLSAHIGCSEILGYTLPVKKTCNVLAYGGEKAELMSLRKDSFNGSNIRMIPVGYGESHSDMIMNALDNGEIIAVFADRIMSSKNVITSEICGHEALLAKNPFSLAATRGIDVVMVSAMKEKDGAYTAYFTPLEYDKTAPLKQQRQQLADAYAQEITRLLTKYPDQWFNYFNLWKD